MLDSILKEEARQGRTIVMTSHDLARVEDLSSRFDVLSRGVICASVSKQNMPKDGLLAFYRNALGNGGEVKGVE